MNLPDFANLTIGQIAGYLIPLAFLVFVTGVTKAFASSTVLWAYLANWLATGIGPALILIAVAIVARGIPGVSEPNVAVGLIFVPAAATYVLAELAAIARNLGMDLSKLPFASNVRQVFEPDAVKKP